MEHIAFQQISGREKLKANASYPHRAWNWYKVCIPFCHGHARHPQDSWVSSPVSSSVLLSAGVDWGYLMLLYLFVQLSRVAVVVILYPGLAASGYGLSWKESIVLIWSGLRGAVALTLALTVSVKTCFGCTCLRWGYGCT